MASVLLIEDDIDAGQAFKEAFMYAGHAVQVCQRAADARSRLDYNDFDVVVLDLDLPDESGPELLERLRLDPRRKGLPVVIYTAYPVTPELRAELATADALVEKSGDLGPVLAAVDAVLHPSRAHG